MVIDAGWVTITATQMRGIMGFSCLFSLLLAGAPRLALVFLWIFRPERIEFAFDSWIVPVLA